MSQITKKWDEEENFREKTKHLTFSSDITGITFLSDGTHIFFKINNVEHKFKF